jgi:antitoxin HigA-1
MITGKRRRGGEDDPPRAPPGLCWGEREGKAQRDRRRPARYAVHEDQDEIVDLDHEDHHRASIMSAAASIRMKTPAHPGGFVKHEIIEPHGLSVTDAARVLGVTRPALSALLNERATLSPEMALRIEKGFGVPMDTLMRMQNSHDIA